jgi:hypothetical protein
MTSRGRQGKEVTNVPGASGPSYHELSSLVIQTDRSEIVRRDKEAGSDMVESIWGRINASEMGARAGRESVPVSSKKTSNILGLRSAQNSASLLDEFADGIELIYTPKSKETQTALEHLLTFIQHEADFMDQPASTVRSAADDVLAILKSVNDSWKDIDRKNRIEEVLELSNDSISSEKYSQLVNLARRITDYPASSFIDDEGKGALRNEGVAVVFDKDEGSGAEYEEFGVAQNLAEDVEEDEDEAEFEKTLPIPRSMISESLSADAIIDIDSLAFSEGNFILF